MIDTLPGKTMILGIGAPRTGTSWLFNFLNTYEEIACTPLKELHYFDTRFMYELSRTWSRRFELYAVDSFLSKTDGERFRKLEYRRALVDRLRMEYSEAGYLGHFERICTERHTHICEFTPSYMVLRPEHFEHIIELFKARDIKLKIVFLMRDPVKRHWSQLRYQGKQGVLKDVMKEFDNSLGSRNLFERTAYHKTIMTLRKVFPSEDVFCGFYETLFETATIEKLQSFLQIPHKQANISLVINNSQTSRAPSLGTPEYRKLGAVYKSVYEFCIDEFGSALPQAWQDSFDEYVR